MAFSASTYILARAYASSQIQKELEGLASGLTFKGSVPDVNNLPTGAAGGDMYIVIDSDLTTPGNQGAKAVWDGTKWVIFDQIPTAMSQLTNDVVYLSSQVNGTTYVDNIHVDGLQAPRTAPTTGHEYIISEVQFDRGTYAELENTVPKLGEPIFEYDATKKTYKFKIGDGVTKYSVLPYIGEEYKESADGTSIVETSGKFALYGFAGTGIGTMPRRSKAGNLEWVEPASVFNIYSGKATEISKVVDTDYNVNYIVDVLADGNSVVINDANELSVPFDNNTIHKNAAGKWAAHSTEAGAGIKVDTDTAGNYTIGAKLVAGNNIVITETSEHALKITSAGSGAPNLVEGVGMKIETLDTGEIKLSGNYKAGKHVEFVEDGTEVTINITSESTVNTFRPIQLNGTEILSDEPKGLLNFRGDSEVAYGIQITPEVDTDGASLEFEIANKHIAQFEKQPDGETWIADLKSNIVVIDCGGADLF